MGKNCSGFSDMEIARQQRHLDKPHYCYDAISREQREVHEYFYQAGKGCEKCKIWDFIPKDCTVQNEIVAKQKCGIDRLDEKCFAKKIVKDECGCDVLDCVRSDGNEQEMIIPVDMVCPKNHVRKSGVSPCMKQRDVCIPCPPLVTPECLSGVVTDDTDCNGCPMKRCMESMLPSPNCENCLTLPPCHCHHYVLIHDNRGKESLRCSCDGSVHDEKNNYRG